MAFEEYIKSTSMGGHISQFSSPSEKKFLNQLLDKIKIIELFQSSALQKYAFRLIPFENLKMQATLKLSLLPEDSDIELDDLVILELLDWFKNSFFKWMDVPKCNACDVVTQGKGYLSPTAEDTAWCAGTVEHFVCPTCCKSFRFPRYNHPCKLLNTRIGRCGEWAICFTFLCICLGYEARLIVDWTDHLWTEIYSESRNKWIHCDPCENICDRPLMYEIGWKKKLSYVIAFSEYEVQDVTWRYTCNFKETLKRRTLCRESFLLQCIYSVNERLLSRVQIEKKKYLMSRRVQELTLFLTPPKPESDNYTGRTSGSLLWRLSRGEIGSLVPQSSYIFTLSSKDIEKKYLHIKYSCSSDKYFRSSDHSIEGEGWTSCTFSHSNVFRKVEKDWKMTYLARTEGSSEGIVTWKFDFENCDLVIKNLRLNLHSEVFDSGKVRWLIFPGLENNQPIIYSPNDVCPLETQHFRGTKGFLLSAELSGGKSWQHSQIFRQALDSVTFPFEVEIHFDKISS
ncbi:peptide-N(4)-(N-acetyl-beta-glucosaminyl) asparagine amidase [Trichonephila clavata]|uniref:Peptide-N(4)-(N-acetyl-beta-glucosaminyl)asparagine amidase n=1 Tax=Trichonephila clavata TaxID=2740835 RepID=A0A8X6M6G9_TRICU|nr:peptide-N(4)-(N-acetyl-beta-glucosaminyl) asparagine amidase [Trichonephila clavata]